MDAKDLEIMYLRLISLMQSRSETNLYEMLGEGNFLIAEKDGYQYVLRLEKDEDANKIYRILASLVLYKEKDREVEIIRRMAYPVEQNTNCKDIYFNLVTDFRPHFGGIADVVYTLDMLLVKGPAKSQEQTGSSKSQNAIEPDKAADDKGYQGESSYILYGADSPSVPIIRIDAPGLIMAPLPKGKDLFNTEEE